VRPIRNFLTGLKLRRLAGRLSAFPYRTGSCCQGYMPGGFAIGLDMPELFGPAIPPPCRPRAPANRLVWEALMGGGALAPGGGAALTVESCLPHPDNAGKQLSPRTNAR
jgi:hypothetical protein